MNREIKFRAWNIKKQEWFIPVYEAYNGNLYDISITVNGYVMERTIDCNASMLNSKNYILQQFTGLKDKNGVDIYLDDLYKDEENDIFKVIKMNCGRFALEMLSNNYIDEFIDWNKIEIIGNIYENPELLNK